MTTELYSNPRSVQDVLPHLDSDLDAEMRSLVSAPHGVLDTPIAITFFNDARAFRKRERKLSLIELAILISGTHAPDKGGLPWLKLARFGPQKSVKGSLRTNDNLARISGVELDYDGGPLTPEEAAQRLIHWQLSGLIYTTPSHGLPGKGNRWRVLLPLSGELLRDEREVLVAWAVGALCVSPEEAAGVDPASFTLSTAFYYGGTSDGVPVQTHLVNGRFLDECAELEQLAVGKRRTERGVESAASCDPELLRDALTAVPNDDLPYDEWLGIVTAIHGGTGGAEEGREIAHLWSQQSGKYDSDDLDRRWDSFGHYTGPKKTGASILYMARQNGWREPPEFLFFDEDVPPANVFFEPVPPWADHDVSPREWLIDGLIPHGTVTMLGGDGGTGKSLLALQLAVATASGRRWVGRAVKRPGRVTVLSAEDDRDELHRRLADICKGEGIDLARLDQLMIRSLAGEDALLATVSRKSNALRKTGRYDELEAAIAHNRPTLLVLDTLADLHSGEENSRAHARQFIGLLRHLAIRYRCAVLLLAHPSLVGMANGSGLSGSTAWNASVRSRLYLDRVKGDDNVEADPNVRVLRTVKANYAAIGGEIVMHWDRGLFVAEHVDGGRNETHADKADRVFMKLLAQHSRYRSDVSPKRSPTFAPKVFADDEKREGVGKAAFEAAMHRLLDAGLIETAEKGPASHRRSYLRRGSNA